MPVSTAPSICLHLKFTVLHMLPVKFSTDTKWTYIWLIFLRYWLCGLISIPPDKPSTWRSVSPFSKEASASCNGLICAACSFKAIVSAVSWEKQQLTSICLQCTRPKTACWYEWWAKYRARGYFIKFSIGRFSPQKKNCTQSDLRSYENEGSKRSKINEKGGQLDWKSRRQFIQNALNLLNSTFWWKNRPTLGPSISGTKCDRDNPILFCWKRGSNGLCWGIK